MIPPHHILFVAWQSPADRATYPIARLLRRDSEPRYEFVYLRGAVDAQKQGFVPFLEMPDTGLVYRFERLPPLFTNRLMPRSRADFPDYIARLGLGDRNGVPAPELILARSEGRKVTDQLELTSPPAFDTSTKTWAYFGFARGVRHIEGADAALQSVRVGDPLDLERDLANGWDARALLVLRPGRVRVGFVPHVLVEDLGGLLDRGAAVRAEVARINAAPAPVQQRLLVKFIAAHVPGFAPMSTARFEPVASDAQRIDLGTAARMSPA